MASYVLIEVVTSPPTLTIMCEDQPMLDRPTTIVIASSAPLALWQDIRIGGNLVVFDRVGDRSLTASHIFTELGDVTIRATLKDDVLNEAYVEKEVHIIPYSLADITLRREDSALCSIRASSSKVVLRREQGRATLLFEHGRVTVRKMLPRAVLRSEQLSFVEITGEEEKANGGNGN